jgi:hypothetical protein
MASVEDVDREVSGSIGVALGSANEVETSVGMVGVESRSVELGVLGRGLQSARQQMLKPQ